MSWDLVVKLPLSQERVTKVLYDSILVIVDRLTKYAYFLPYYELYTIEDLTYTFLRNIVNNYRLLDDIVNNKGTTFTSKF